MKEKAIGDLVYEIKRARERDGLGAIVFLGAGCSMTGNIPGTDAIIAQVLAEHAESPAVKRIYDPAKALADAEAKELGREQANEKEIRRKIAYADIMDAIGPDECARLFKDYVESDNVRINVTHIYLAQLMREDYVDFIVTTNFDNLAQRALALYNRFPPIYDLPNFKELSTYPLHKGSITHLHGTYNGLWQLNSKDEMAKVIVSGFVRDIFRSITDKRPWIVVGYSGDDPILDQLASLQPFRNGINWVTYKDNEPSLRVKEKLFANATSGAYWIKGYDSDKFFLKLNRGLVASEPHIIDKPFSFLQLLQSNLIDIQDEEEYKTVKDRLAQTKTFVDDSIRRYEGKEGEKMTEAAIDEVKLGMKLIEIFHNDEYQQVHQYEEEVLRSGNEELRNSLANIYDDWAYTLLMTPANAPDREKALREALEKAEKAVALGSDHYNLACAHALLGNKDQALHLLAQCLEQDQITFAHVADDPDWDTLRTDPAYLALQEKYG